MIEKLPVKIQRSDRSIVVCEMEVSGAFPATMTFTGEGFEKQVFIGPDLFNLLAELRLKLEKLECRLLCAGARVDVFPSAMCRGGGGRKAYILRLGSPTKTSDLVDIFDYAPPELIGTVEQQRFFHENWFKTFTGETDIFKPFEGEVAEAKRHPNGWVYRIAGTFEPDQKIPPEAIVGAWKVNVDGVIVGSFVKNEKFDPTRWPRRRFFRS